MRKHINFAVKSIGPPFSGKLVQFGILTWLALIMSPTQFGQFSALQIVVVGIGSIFGSTLSLAGNRFASQHRANLATTRLVGLGARRYQRELLMALTTGSVLAPLLYSWVSSAPVIPQFAILGVAVLCSTTTDLLLATLAGSGRFWIASYVEGGRVIANSLLAFLGGTAAGAPGAVAGLFGADVILALAVLCCALFTVAKTPLAAQAERSSAPTRFGIASNLLGQAQQWILIFLLQRTQGFESVALYAVANRFATFAILIPGYLTRNALARLNLSLSNRDGRFAPLARRYLSGVLVLALGCAVIAWAAPLLAFREIHLRYPTIGQVAAVLCLAAVFQALSNSLGVICVSQRRWKLWLFSDLSATCTVLIIGVVCWIAQGGIIGLLFGLAAGNAVCGSVRLTSLWRTELGGRMLGDNVAAQFIQS